MNKSFCLFLLLFFFGLRLAAQVFPSPVDNPVWDFRMPPATLYKSEKLWVETDTVFADGTYWFEVTAALEYNPDFRDRTNIGTPGWYRVEGDKVIFKDRLGLAGTLYDFSLEVGDEALILPPGNVGPDPILYRVIEKDAITCNGTPRRRLRLVYDAFSGF